MDGVLVHPYAPEKNCPSVEVMFSLRETAPFDNDSKTFFAFENEEETY
jgi:hypothetical protein